MKEDCFQAEFQDVFIECEKSALKSFILKLLQAKFTISWRYFNEKLELVILNGDRKVIIPIRYLNEKRTVIQLHELSIHMEDLAILLEELIAEAKGRAIVKTASEGSIYVSCIENGKIVSVIKFSGGEDRTMGSYRTMKMRSPMEKIDPEVKRYVLTSEIDYFLMELAEALKNNDVENIEKLKLRLTSLVHEMNRLNG